MSKKIFIFRNNKDNSMAAHSDLLEVVKARGYEVLKEYSDSLFTTDARKRYRELRGDFNSQAN